MSNGKVRADELRELIDHVFAELDADERRGSVLQAAGLRVRLEITDLDMVVRVRPSEEGRHHLHWAFVESDEADATSFSLTMDSATANAYLQGHESLAVAIARGRVRCSGDLKHKLVCVPALKLLVDPYRSWVHRLHPHLSLT